MNKIFTLIALCVCQLLIAQPNLTMAWLPDTTIHVDAVNFDGSSATLGVGSSGANRTWNLSNLPLGQAGTINYQSVASSLYGASFSTATICEYSLLQGFLYTYYKADSTKYSLVGYVDQYGNGSNNEPKDFLHFPATYQTAFNDFSTYYSNYGSSYSVGTIIETVTADGYGTLKTPFANYSHVLRFKVIEAGNDTSVGGSVVTSTFTNEKYFWVTPDIKGVVLAFINKDLNTGYYSKAVSNYTAIEDVEKIIRQM